VLIDAFAIALALAIYSQAVVCHAEGGLGKEQ
jgi:hypothetical protein